MVNIILSARNVLFFDLIIIKIKSEVITLTGKKCFNCEKLIIDTVSHLFYIDQFICRDCLEIINESELEKAIKSYPVLVRPLNITGRSCSKSFESYCKEIIKSVINDLYNKKVLKKKHINKRKDFVKYLPTTITKTEILALKKMAVCALTDSSHNITLDHFIPLEWGHGGEYIGNIYFITKELNASKSNINPFKWINKISSREDICMIKWDQLIRDLAADNGLSVKDFRIYVNWCEKNKRSKEQLMADDCTSLELWKAYAKWACFQRG
jgi:hypothetical protein